MAFLDDVESNVQRRDTGTTASTSSSPLSFAERPTPQFFRLDLFHKDVSRGLGHVVALAACSSSLWVATSKNYLIRYDDSNGKVQERKLDCVTVKKLFALEDGEHLLATVHDGKNLETLCVRTKELMKRRPSAVAGLQGLYLTSAAICGTHTVVGSDTGVLYGSETPSGPFLKLLELPQRQKRRSPVSGLTSIEHEGELVLLALCGAYLQSFRMPSHDAWFEDGVQVHPVELPIEQDAAQLQVMVDAGNEVNVSRRFRNKKQLGILSTSGVYFGEFPRLESLLAEPIPFSCEPGETLPISMALTRYHIVLLYPTKLQFVNIESRVVAQELPIEGPIMGLSRDLIEGRLFLLAGDDVHEIDYSDEDRDMWRVFLAHCKYARALPLCRTTEQRNAVYLGQAETLFGEGQYEDSARIFGKITASLPSFDEVACRFLGLDDTRHSGGDDGRRGICSLQAFLESKMSTLSGQDVLIRTMMSTWVLELLLQAEKGDGRESLGGIVDEVCGREVLYASREMDGRTDISGIHDVPSASLSTPCRISDFLVKNVDFLHPRTTMSLLEEYGMTHELLTYARARKDDDTEVELLMSAGETAQVIRILRKPTANLALVYKFAAPMIAQAPVDTVSLWMDILHSRKNFVDTNMKDCAKSMNMPTSMVARLDPLLLLPALARYAQTGTPRIARSEIIRFLNFTIDLEGFWKGSSGDRYGDNPLTALHDLNISLLTVDDDNEDLLLEKIAAHRSLYDPLQALSLCRKRGRNRATIALLVQLELWRDATDRALELDEDNLARSIACQCTDPDLRKQLLLNVIEYLLLTQPSSSLHSTDKVVRIMAESGCISVDDVLALLPDSESLFAFKGLISSSIRASTAKTEERKLQIKLAGSALCGIDRCASTSMSSLKSAAQAPICNSCKRHALTDSPPSFAGPSGGLLPPHYAFPTGNHYHGACLCHEVALLADPEMALALKKMAKSLASVSVDSNDADILDTKRALDAVIGTEDPLCGERMVGMVQKPFFSRGIDIDYLNV